MTQNGGYASVFRELYDFASAARKRQLAGVLALMLLGAVAELLTIGAIVPFLALLAGPSSLAELPSMDRLFALFGASSREDRLLAATLLFMMAAVLAAAVRLLLTWMTQRFILGLGHELSVEVQRRLLAQPYSYHVRHNSSEVIASLEQVQVLVSGVLLQLMYAATAAVVSLFIVFALVELDAIVAGSAAIAVGLVYGTLSLTVWRRLASNSAIVGSAYGQRVRLVQEGLGGIRDVILDGSQEAYLDAFTELDRRFALARANTAFIGAAPRLIVEAAGIVFIAAATLVIAGREGGLAAALPILGALALGAQRLLPLFQQIYYSWTSLAGNAAVIDQVLVLLRLPLRENRSASGAPLKLRDAIVFDDVSFTYPGRKRPALQNIDLTIPGGSRLALVGKTGSGKSTLADLLMGLLEPTEGHIFIDGVALTGETHRAWQNCIAHVPQSIFLSDRSIAANIAIGALEIDMDHVRRAAQAADFDSFVSDLPQGYETMVGERGVRLSGGQRQRLAIARAIYKDAPVLVFDEATSALDEETERAVLRALDRMGDEGRTIVIIAHRPSTIAHCDFIVRLESGRVAEFAPAPRVSPKSARR